MTEQELVVQIENGSGPYQPGDVLKASYRLPLGDTRHVEAAEVSVLWHTEGKGSEDVGVHHFARHEIPEGAGARLNERFEVRLPASPLSYNGFLVKIRWCVRVRAFLDSGQVLSAEAPFQLGNVPPGREAGS